MQIDLRNLRFSRLMFILNQSVRTSSHHEFLKESSNIEEALWLTGYWIRVCSRIINKLQARAVIVPCDNVSGALCWYVHLLGQTAKVIIFTLSQPCISYAWIWNFLCKILPTLPCSMYFLCLWLRYINFIINIFDIWITVLLTKKKCYLISIFFDDSLEDRKTV